VLLRFGAGIFFPGFAFRLPSVIAMSSESENIFFGHQPSAGSENQQNNYFI
jgi:hypothetical protein